MSHFSQGLTELSQDALLIKHLALVSVLVVIVDFLSEVSRQFVEGHVLLHLFVLREKRDDFYFLLMQTKTTERKRFY